MEIPHRKLFVKQIVETVEVFTGFETKNRYQVLTEHNEPFSYAFEESSFLSRHFLKRMRPAKIKLMDNEKNIYVSLERPFYFFLPKMKILDGEGRVIANVKAKFSFVKKVLEIRMPNGGNFMCLSKALHPWTFNFILNGREFARISKKWSGGKELLTDSDNFLVDFMNTTDENLKLVILAMAFGIDITYFER